MYYVIRDPGKDSIINIISRLYVYLISSVHVLTPLAIYLWYNVLVRGPWATHRGRSPDLLGRPLCPWVARMSSLQHIFLLLIDSQEV